MTTKVISGLRTFASGLPETDEGLACVGTPLEKSTFRARKKAFLFLGVRGHAFDVMVKLRESIPEATALAKQEPDRYKVGSSGWVTARFADGQSPPKGLLERWIAESYNVLVGTSAQKPAAAKKTATKRARSV